MGVIKTKLSWMGCVLAAGLLIPVMGRAAESISAEQGKIEVRPVGHATFWLEWNGKTILVDPVGGADKFKEKPDLILVTDIHGDHLNVETLEGVTGEETAIVAPKAVAEKLPEGLQESTTVMANREKKEVAGIQIEASQRDTRGTSVACRCPGFPLSRE